MKFPKVIRIIKAEDPISYINYGDLIYPIINELYNKRKLKEINVRWSKPKFIGYDKNGRPLYRRILIAA